MNNVGYVFDNLIYSDMLVGINTDNPTFNLTTAGNICFVPNEVINTAINIPNLLNNYLNIIDINSIGNSTISLPQSSNDGQLLNISIGNVNAINTSIILDISSNIKYNNSTSNLVLQNSGDTISFCSYNKQWLITGTNIKPPSVIPTKQYNQVNASSYTFNSINNGLLTVLNLDANLSISLPSAVSYNGYVIEMVVGSNINSRSANLLLGNVITSRTSINLSNISDKIKLLGTLNGWLEI